MSTYIAMSIDRGRYLCIPLNNIFLLTRAISRCVYMRGKGVHVQPVNNCSMPLKKCYGRHIFKITVLVLKIKKRLIVHILML